ncbi:MAG TPA: right-handed parallel beta-helix repeat-containing protein [Acidobacteriota bacterium]|nr:right-handed parallel beta-helix repeat-containing protein [Acidobacteriota bacterium]
MTSLVAWSARRTGAPVTWIAAIAVAACASLAAPGAAWSRTITISPSVASGDEEFETVANTLQPGDTLILRGGDYSQSARRAVTCAGTPGLPVVIRSYPGERAVLTRPADNIDTQNNIELVQCSYLELRDLGFQGGSIGVRVIGGHHVTIEGCEIWGTGNNAIAMNSSGYTYDAFVIRRNHIHDTGQSGGNTEGEGMYLGCNYDACRVVNSVVESNWIHHLRATSDGGNDGIEVKPGGGGNLIRNNVIHDNNIGRQYPGIFVYGGGSAPNIVEGNAIWNSGEAIQVVSDAVVRNNVIFNSSVTGITASPHTQIATMKNVTIANNTIYGTPEGVYVRWTGATNMILANNAIYCPGAAAVNATLGGGTARSNYVEGSLSGVTLDNARFFAGGTAAGAFVDPSAFDFWPRSGSPLRGVADVTYAPANDFNATTRTSPFDVGAYELEGQLSNPGWPIGPGFKGVQAGGDSDPPSATRDLRAP